jgi:hypothetical protein
LRFGVPVKVETQELQADGTPIKHHCKVGDDLDYPWESLRYTLFADRVKQQKGRPTSYGANDGIGAFCELA